MGFWLPYPVGSFENLHLPEPSLSALTLLSPTTFYTNGAQPFHLVHWISSARLGAQPFHPVDWISSTRLVCGPDSVHGPNPVQYADTAWI